MNDNNHKSIFKNGWLSSNGLFACLFDVKEMLLAVHEEFPQKPLILIKIMISWCPSEEGKGWAVKWRKYRLKKPWNLSNSNEFPSDHERRRRWTSVRREGYNRHTPPLVLLMMKNEGMEKMKNVNECPTQKKAGKTYLFSLFLMSVMWFNVRTVSIPVTIHN